MEMAAWVFNKDKDTEAHDEHVSCRSVTHAAPTVRKTSKAFSDRQKVQTLASKPAFIQTDTQTQVRGGSERTTPQYEWDLTRNPAGENSDSHAACTAPAPMSTEGQKGHVYSSFFQLVS